MPGGRISQPRDCRGLIFPPSKIFRWIAQPVEPFCFAIILSGALALLLVGDGKGLRKHPCLLGEMADGEENKLQDIHIMGLVGVVRLLASPLVGLAPGLSGCAP